MQSYSGNLKKARWLGKRLLILKKIRDDISVKFNLQPTRPLLQVPHKKAPWYLNSPTGVNTSTSDR